MSSLSESDLLLASRFRGLHRLHRGYAHDLKAPINAIGLNLQLLSQLIATDRDLEEDKRERLGRYAGVIEGEVARLHRSLEVLLAHTRPPAEEAERFALQEAISELEHLLRPQARQQRVEVRVEQPPQTLLLVGRRDQIEQALVNVAVNALEAMPEGGELALAVTAEEQEVIVTIHDTGPGIPAENRETIFDMHMTTKKNGSGIGLYAARKVVEGHGGTIGVVSAPGEETTFEIRLPRFDVEAAKAAIQEVSS